MVGAFITGSFQLESLDLLTPSGARLFCCCQVKGVKLGADGDAET